MRVSVLRTPACPRRLKLDPRGVGRKNWTGLFRKVEALPVFEGTERANGDLDTLFVLPADIRINDLDELLNS